MTHKKLLATVLFAAMCGQALAVPLGTSVTYQGQLKSGGLPANGTFNLIFTLWDAAGSGTPPVGGNQLGNADNEGATTVVNGLFTVQLNDTNQFGSSAFIGEARWLQISVNGSVLGPRQPLNAAPFAMYALSGPGATGTWTVNGTHIFNSNSGNVGVGVNPPTTKFQVVDDFYVNSSSNFVSVNRTNRIGAEYFGVRAPVTNGYGGMYMETAGTNGLPFYGYATAGVARMWTYYDGAGETWHVNNGGNRLTVDSAGNVGIGTTTPFAPLNVMGSTAAGELVYVRNSSTGRAATFESLGSGSTSACVCYKPSGAALQVISALSTAGVPDAAAPLSILGGGDAELAGGGFLVCGPGNGSNVSIDNNEIMARNNGNSSPLYLNNNGGDVIIAPQGTARVRVLEITGADVAEKFPSVDKPEPGTVMEIDPEHAGQLRIARGAYNTRVAGVVSGANNFPAGTILGNIPGHEDAPPVALSGRVYVHCDATRLAIEIGDLLTTSDTPGHAMKAADRGRAYGAVIGKAMTHLAAGEKGLVLVMVNLQ